ncbi:hypothetical protein PMIN02_003725 [Paraphaeosphaeria minitans]
MSNIWTLPLVSLPRTSGFFLLWYSSTRNRNPVASSMKLLLFFSLLLLPLIFAGDFWNDPVFRPLWDDRYKQKVITPHDGWKRPGIFTHPPAANRNSTDFDRNERVLINSTYPLQWAWTNVTRNMTWDLYLVNHRYEKRLIFRPTDSQANMSGYLWEVEDTSNNPFLDNSAMAFFYVVRRDGVWSEGFASRFVNISRRDWKTLGMTSGAGICAVDRLVVVPLLAILSFLINSYCMYFN